jgi:transposase
MIIIGVDMSKLKFHIFYQTLDGKNINKSFANNPEGFKALTNFLPKNEDVCLGVEATGTYGDMFVNYMYNHNAVVYVINPAIIKYYGKSLGYRVKTDKQDAKLICNFVKTNKDNNLYAWKPLSANHQKVKAFNRCLDNLKAEVVKFRNMCESQLDMSIKEMYGDIIKKLEEAIQSIKSQIKLLINQDIPLKATIDLLQTIPGVAECTAWNLLSELPDLKKFKNAKQLAAYAGLNPAIKQSGSSVHGRGSISKMGTANLRKSLYFPAVVALRCNPGVYGLRDRLQNKGKNGKVIVIAVMHKLLRIIFAILKNGKPFECAYHKG